MEDHKHRTFSQKKKVNNQDELNEPQAALGESLFLAIKGQLSRFEAESLKPGLYVVATPIGNLADMTLRALMILAKADVVACEDTRHSRKLISAYGLRRRLETYHDFSDAADRDRFLGLLAAGRSLALICDAGTPLIADPGYKLVRAALEQGYPVTPIPGASAAIGALVVSGLPTDQFTFAGFLPSKEVARRQSLEAASTLDGTVIFYETGQRMKASLSAMVELLPLRKVVIARELTKLHEEILTGTPAELLTAIGARELLGEMVLLVGPEPEGEVAVDVIEAALRRALKRASLKEAVGEVAKGLGVQRKMVYSLALKMKGEEA